MYKKSDYERNKRKTKLDAKTNEATEIINLFIEEAATSAKQSKKYIKLNVTAQTLGWSGANSRFPTI